MRHWSDLTRTVLLMLLLFSTTASMIFTARDVAADEASVPITKGATAWEPGALTFDASVLRPFRATYRQTAGDAPAGGRTLTLEQEVGANGARWHFVIALETAATVHDEITFRSADFAPEIRRVELPGHFVRSELWAGFDRARVAVVQADRVDSEEITTDGPRFAGASLDLMTALRSRSEDGAVRAPVYSSDFGPLGNLTIEIAFGETETIEAAGRSWRTRRVSETVFDAAGEPLRLPDGSAFPVVEKWVVPEPPYVVRAHYGPLVVEVASLTVFDSDR